MNLRDFAFIMAAACAMASAMVAWRRATYRPVCAFLWYVVLSGMVREQLVGRIVRPAKDAVIAAGVDPLATAYPARVVWAAHADHALHLGAILGVAALAAAVFVEGWRVRSFIAALVLWAIVSAIQIGAYPHVRGHGAELAFYLPAGVASALVSAVCVIAWSSRRVSPQVEHVAVLILVAIDSVITLSIFDRSGARWGLALGASLIAYCALALIEGVWLCWLSSSRAS